MERSVDTSSWPYVRKLEKPLLSICITTYNRAKWLAINLATVRRWVAPYRDSVEVVVCDNSSEDNTPEVVKLYLSDRNFHYYRNPKNVGMLGNLKVTAHHAKGKYVWIIGDDDVIKESAIKAVLEGIRKYQDVSLIYLNYAYTRIVDAAQVGDVDRFLKESTPIVQPGPNQYSKIKGISTKSENFFTAIYCLVYRRDHALRAYSQCTSGRPFSTLLTCIPTSYYVCNYMFEDMGLWIGEPQVVVNMNVSWLKYATLWVLERLPELYDLAERRGADADSVDKWRTHNFAGLLHYLNEIYVNDEADNLPHFSIDRLIQRHKHLPIFRENLRKLIEIYKRAYHSGRSLNSPSPDILIERYSLDA
jgi:glycosyltransferase involved in cell wall biosynthesis